MVDPIVKSWIHRVIAAMVYLCPNKSLPAVVTFEILESCINLHKNILPRYLLLPQKHYKLIDIPLLITDMLSYNRSIIINEDLCFRTSHPFPLAVCK